MYEECSVSYGLLVTKGVHAVSIFSALQHDLMYCRADV